MTTPRAIFIEMARLNAPYGAGSLLTQHTRVGVEARQRSQCTLWRWEPSDWDELGWSEARKSSQCTLWRWEPSDERPWRIFGAGF